MTRAKMAFAAVTLIAAFTLVWIAMPTIHAAVPTWIVIDALVAQIVILAGLSGGAR